MKPSELCALMEAAAGDEAKCKSVFITLGEYRLQTTMRNILPLLLQLWEAVSAEKECLATRAFCKHANHYEDTRTALAALDQYGGGGEVDLYLRVLIRFMVLTAKGFL